MRFLTPQYLLQSSSPILYIYDVLYHFCDPKARKRITKRKLSSYSILTLSFTIDLRNSLEADTSEWKRKEKLMNNLKLGDIKN